MLTHQSVHAFCSSMLSGKKKSKGNDKRPLKIAGNRPVSEAYLNAFFKVFSVDQIYFFEELYNELSPKLSKLGINGEQFMEQIKDAYTRYQEHRNIDAFSPMDKKGQKYVEDFMRKSIDQVYAALTKTK